MNSPRLALLLALASTALLAACARPSCRARGTWRHAAARPETPFSAARLGPAAPARPAPTEAAAEPTPSAYGLTDSNGARITIDEFIATHEAADVFVFGELHGDAVGAQHQLELMRGLAATPRPPTLLLEFFEMDVQPAIDAWLEGSIDDAELARRARQGKDFATTHLPLLRVCKEAGLDARAANAPRRLVTAWRKSELDWAGYLASLAEEERAWLPATTHEPHDAYRERFMALMGEARGATFFRSQALWDDAMAAAVAAARETNPAARALLVVGAFHADGRLGTIAKIAERRPHDRIAVLLMDAAENPDASPSEVDRQRADALLRVRPTAKPAP